MKVLEMFMVVQKNSQLLMPSDVSTRVGFFDRFAGRAALFASRAPFFAFCVLLVALWLLQGFITIVIKGDQCVYDFLYVASPEDFAAGREEFRAFVESVNGSVR